MTDRSGHKPPPMIDGHERQARTDTELDPLKPLHETILELAGVTFT
ncbi:hypothetical protein [Sorangium sp. So ce388]